MVAALVRPRDGFSVLKLDKGGVGGMLTFLELNIKQRRMLLVRWTKGWVRMSTQNAEACHAVLGSGVFLNLKLIRRWTKARGDSFCE